MNISEAIVMSQEQIRKNGESLREQRKKWAQIKWKQVNKEARTKEEKKELLKKWREKAAESIKDKELMEGLRYLEQNGAKFTLSRGLKWVLYFCSDSSYKIQFWGWYMGNNNIHKVNNGLIEFLDVETIQRVLRMGFKEQLIEQILALNPKIDAFKEMFVQK